MVRRLLVFIEPIEVSFETAVKAIELVIDSCPSNTLRWSIARGGFKLAP
jgi:hypothetical protein